MSQSIYQRLANDGRGGGGGRWTTTVDLSDVNVAAVSPVETFRDEVIFISDGILLFLPAAKTKERKSRDTLKPQKPLEVFGEAKTHFALTSFQLFNECFQYLTTVLPSY